MFGEFLGSFLKEAFDTARDPGNGAKTLYGFLRESMEISAFGKIVSIPSISFV